MKPAGGVATPCRGRRKVIWSPRRTDPPAECASVRLKTRPRPMAWDILCSKLAGSVLSAQMPIMISIISFFFANEQKNTLLLFSIERYLLAPIIIHVCYGFPGCLFSPHRFSCLIVLLGFWTTLGSWHQYNAAESGKFELLLALAPQHRAALGISSNIPPSTSVASAAGGCEWELRLPF